MRISRMPRRPSPESQNTTLLVTEILLSTGSRVVFNAIDFLCRRHGILFAMMRVPRRNTGWAREFKPNDRARIRPNLTIARAAV